MQQKKHLKVKRSHAGLGLITERDIPRGDFIIEYTGEHITDEEADRRGGRYLFTVSKKLTLDAKNRKHLARYINHSCAPNCRAEISQDDKHVYIYAKKKIHRGEELTYHYGKEYWEDIIGGAKKCKCEKCKEIRSRKKR